VVKAKNHYTALPYPWGRVVKYIKHHTKAIDTKEALELDGDASDHDIEEVLLDWLEGRVDFGWIEISRKNQGVNKA